MIFILLNPRWGSHEWKGRWSDHAKEWTPQLLKALNFAFEDDGTFFMCFEDFVSQFNRLYVLRLVTSQIGTKWFKHTIKDKWTKDTAGCILVNLGRTITNFSRHH